VKNGKEGGVDGVKKNRSGKWEGPRGWYITHLCIMHGAHTSTKRNKKKGFYVHPYRSGIACFFIPFSWILQFLIRWLVDMGTDLSWVKALGGGLTGNAGPISVLTLGTALLLGLYLT